MKLSAKTEYACVAILELASSYGTGEPVRSREIARRHGVPHRFLIQILLELKAAGLVASTRGTAGGYHLTCSPENVSLGQVMDVMKGPALTSSSASPDSPAVKVLTEAWEAVHAKVRQILDEITFAELADRVKEEVSLTYYI